MSQSQISCTNAQKGHSTIDYDIVQPAPTHSQNTTSAKATDGIAVPNEDAKQTRQKIFDRNAAPPMAKYVLPDIGERITSTPQLGYCLSLLNSSLVPEELNESERSWLHTRLDDSDEQQRFQTVATDLIKAFVRDELKKPDVVAEVVSLAAVLDQDDFRKLLQTFVDGIDRSVLLELHILDGLAQLIRNSIQGYIEADDLAEILRLLSTRLKHTQKQSSRHAYRLALTISNILDSMVDCQVEGLSSKHLLEPLSLYLTELQGSSDPYLVYQGAYACQALQYIPADETILQTTLRHTGNVAQGVSGVVSAVKALNVVEFIERLYNIQEGLAGTKNALGFASGAYSNLKTPTGSGEGFLEILKESFSFTRKSAWYPALRGLDRLIQEGRFSEFEELVQTAPCRLDPAFQRGVCLRLGEIAAGAFWDTNTRKCAVVFLGELYKGDAARGQQVNIKKSTVSILNQLADSSDSTVASQAQILLQGLSGDSDTEKGLLKQECEKDHPELCSVMFSLPPQASLLLDCVQSKPDVETPLRQLKRERLKDRGGDVYISPRAKANARAKEDFDLTSKVQEFLDSDRKVFLVLGDSGAGKSTFNRALEVSLWDHYDKGRRIPLFIYLPAIDKPEYDLIAKQLRRVNFTENQIRELKSHHEFILICDGYDESQQTRNLYTSNQLNQPGQWRAQMVISCRTEYNSVDYKDCFQPAERSGGGSSKLFQEATISPFNKDQIQDYVSQYVILRTIPWESEDYLRALKQIPNLQDLVKNPFLLKLALEALPQLLDKDSRFSEARITRIVLYDEFVAQWIERGKIRLREIELSDRDKEAFKELSDFGFKQRGIIYMKQLVTAIYDNQSDNPVVSYSEHRDRKTWKEAIFNKEDGRHLLREAIPLTRDGDLYRFIHKSVLEYGLSLAIFNPSESNETTEPTPSTSRRGSASSVLSFESPVSMETATTATIKQPLLDSPLGRKHFVGEQSILQFLVERVQQQPIFKDQLLSVIEQSKTDTMARIAAANAITILVQAGVQFNGADLRGIKIPMADLSYGVFDSAHLEGADLRKVNFRNIWLRQANLSGAQMTGAHFGEMPFLQEESRIYCCGYSPDSKRYAVGLADGDISLYDTSTWDRTRTLKGHNGGVTHLTFSMTSDRIASGDQENILRLWDVETGDCLHTIQGHTESIWSIMASPKGGQIASGSWDNTVRLWDIDTGDCIHTLQGHSNVVYSIAYSPNGDRIASASHDETVRLWDVDSGDCIKTLEGHDADIASVAYSPKGDQVASGSADMTVRVWDIDTGDCVHTLQGHNRSVICVSYSQKGDQIASGSKDHTVRLWDADTGECIHTLEGHLQDVTNVMYSPKGYQVASESRDDNTIRLWDIDSGVCTHTLRGHNHRVNGVMYSPKGDQIASGSYDQTVRLWDVDTRDCIYTIQSHSDLLTSAAYSPNGRQITSGGYDKAARVWDVDTGNCIHTLQGHDDYISSIAYSPKGDQVASKSEDGILWLWDVDTGDCLHTFQRGDRKLSGFAYSLKGDRIVCGSWDGTVYLLNSDTGNCIHTLQGHSKAVTSVAYSPRGDQIASGSEDEVVRLWSVGTGDCEHTLQGHSHHINMVAYSPNGDLIASASNDETVRLWDVATGNCVRALQGHDHYVYIVVFSPKGDQIATASETYDMTVRLWDVETGDCVHTLEGHDKDVNSFVYSPKGNLIASASRDRTVRVWDVEAGQCLVTISDFNGSVESVAWDNASEGYYLVTASHDKSVRRWKIVKEGDEHKALLCWSSSHEVLTVSGTSFSGVQGLSQQDLRLLSQRGALNATTHPPE